jgi:hypothetical protein
MKNLLLPLLIVASIAPANAQFAFQQQAQRQQRQATPPGNEGAVSALVGASEQAKIYRARSMAGGQQYRPQTICQDGDVNIGTDSNQPTHVGNLTVVSGSACPAHMRKGK